MFEAEHRGTGKVVALKCIDIARSADPECIERLAREARAACRVRHPNVVDVYDVGRDGDIMFLVMEYLEGETFSNPLERRDFASPRMLELLLPAMRGVAEAHRQGVIHRDIKPDNIFLARQMDCPTPVAKVLDFGIAKLEARGYELRALTGEGRAIGTPRYMSYEQLLGEDSLDGRTDVYAFGVILYEVLTGRVPYDAETFSELLKLLALSEPLPPEQCRRRPSRAEPPGDVGDRTRARTTYWQLGRPDPRARTVRERATLLGGRTRLELGDHRATPARGRSAQRTRDAHPGDPRSDARPAQARSGVAAGGRGRARARMSRYRVARGATGAAGAAVCARGTPRGRR